MSQRIVPLRTAGRFGLLHVPSGLDARYPAWMAFLRDWHARIRFGTVRAGQHPPWHAIVRWFATEAPPHIRAERYAMRTLKRDVAMLTQIGADGIDRRSAEFIVLWEACLDERLVWRLADRPLSDLVTTAFGFARHAPPPDGLDARRADGKPLWRDVS